VSYLCLIWAFYLDADQVQVFVVEGFIDLAVLALLLAATLALSLLVLFILIYNEACAFLLRVSSSAQFAP
jgi:hypothetical protein